MMSLNTIAQLNCVNEWLKMCFMHQHFIPVFICPKSEEIPSISDKCMGETEGRTAWKQNASGPGCHRSGGSCTTTIKTPKTPHLSLSMREYFLAASHQQSWETFRTYAKKCCRCYWGSQCPNTLIKYFPLICNPSRQYENQCQDIFNLISQHQYCIDLSASSQIRGNDDEWQHKCEEKRMDV